MKTFIIALLVLTILLTSMTMYSLYIDKTEERLIEMIEKISRSIYDNQWEKAKEETKKLLKKWEKDEKILSVFNDHGDLDEIRLELGDLKESVSQDNSEHSLKAVEKLKILLDRLKKNESLTLENILELSPDRLSCHIML